eukprot:Nk52_evm5s2010 gene=Nk52_evmTU5s2010
MPSSERDSVTSEGMPSLERIHTTTNLEDIQNLLAVLDEEERKTEGALSCLLGKREDMEGKVQSLKGLQSKLDSPLKQSTQLTGTIAFTCDLAENVSRKVRELDLAQGNVLLAMKKADDIIDLLECAKGVEKALDSEHIESAAYYVGRYLQFDESVLKDATVYADAGTNPIEILKASEKKLKEYTYREFDSSVRTTNVEQIEKLFKIFPQVGLVKEGLKNYARFQATNIAKESEKRSSDMEGKKTLKTAIHVNQIVSIFENVVKLVEERRADIEEWYGKGVLCLFVKELQGGLDLKLGSILKRFIQERHLQRKLRDIRKVNRTAHSSSTHKSKNSSSDEFAIDTIEIDLLLTETTFLSSKCLLFSNFVSSCVNWDYAYFEKEDAENDESHVFKRNKEILLETPKEEHLKPSELEGKMEEIMHDYIVLEEFYLRESVLKAIRMDDVEFGQITSTCVDDVFFLVQKSIRRAISTGSCDSVCAMLNHGNGILVTEYKQYFQDRGQNAFQGNSIDIKDILSTQFPVASEETSNNAFYDLVLVNNTEVSSEYILKLMSDFEVELRLADFSDKERTKIEFCLNDLTGTSNTFKYMLQTLLEKLCSNSIDSKIKSELDKLAQISYNIDEEQYSSYEVNDPFVQALLAKVDYLLEELKPSMTTSTFEALVIIIGQNMALAMERMIIKKDFNGYGCIQLDNDIRYIVTYLTTNSTFAVREKFSRVSQICTILNLDKPSDIMDYWGANAGSFSWKLTAGEVKQVMGLRVEFKREDIQRLKL